MVAHALTPKFAKRDWAPPECAGSVVTGENDWHKFATPKAHPESLPNYEGTIIVATVWLAAYLLMAFSYYTGVFD